MRLIFECKTEGVDADLCDGVVTQLPAVRQHHRRVVEGPKTGPRLSGVVNFAIRGVKGRAGGGSVALFMLRVEGIL